MWRILYLIYFLYHKTSLSPYDSVSVLMNIRVNRSISVISPVCRWQIAPYASVSRSRCQQLYNTSARRAQVICPHPLQPAGALHLWRACAPLAPRLLIQQCTTGLPPSPPVHEQEDWECKVKVGTPDVLCQFPVMHKCRSTYRFMALPQLRSPPTPKGFNYSVSVCVCVT